MDFINTIKKYFKKEKKFKKDFLTVNPDAYWKSVLLLFTVMILVFLVFGYYLVRKVNNSKNNEPNTSTLRSKTINQEKLNQAIEYFSKREKVSETITNYPSPVIDPSE